MGDTTHRASQKHRVNVNDMSIEDERSWELHRERLSQQTDDGDDDEGGGGGGGGGSTHRGGRRRLHYYTKEERPKIHYDTQHALMIDAGSQGTR